MFQHYKILIIKFFYKRGTEWCFVVEQFKQKYCEVLYLYVLILYIFCHVLIIYSVTKIFTFEIYIKFSKIGM